MLVEPCKAMFFFFFAFFLFLAHTKIYFMHIKIYFSHAKFFLYVCKMIRNGKTLAKKKKNRISPI